MVTVCLVIFLPLVLTSPYNTTLSICCIFCKFIKAPNQIAFFCTCSACSYFAAHAEGNSVTITSGFVSFFHLVFDSFIAPSGYCRILQCWVTLSKVGSREQGAAMHFQQSIDKSNPYGNLNNFFIENLCQSTGLGMVFICSACRLNVHQGESCSH